MPTMTPPAKSIRAFKNEDQFEVWLKSNHAKKNEIYLRIYKKDSGIATVTYAQALDVALCWGWIDGIKKAHDDKSFLQRFTPRKSKSRWSKINRDHVARLIAKGRMMPAGQKQVDAAKADGRWQSAYASPSQISVPTDLMAAIEAEPKALKTFQSLNRQNIYSLAYRILHIKTPVKRAERIGQYVDMLKRGEAIYPNSPTKERVSTIAQREAMDGDKNSPRASVKRKTSEPRKLQSKSRSRQRV